MNENEITKEIYRLKLGNLYIKDFPIAEEITIILTDLKKYARPFTLKEAEHNEAIYGCNKEIIPAKLPELMETILVEKSHIHTLAYDNEQNMMYITFADDRKYRYLDVPKKAFDELKESPSKGSHLHRHFKGTYYYEGLN